MVRGASACLTSLLGTLVLMPVASKLRGTEIDETAVNMTAFEDGLEATEINVAVDWHSAPDGLLSGGCNNGGFCDVNGYMIVAGRSDAVGMENINGANVGYYNSMMAAAHGRCGSSNCVLITNPAGFRTQSRFHIHYRHYNGGGASLKRRLEATVCGEDGWRSGGFPCGGKAKYFGGFPAVFSAAMGAGSISHAGITAWPGSCGGGTILLTSYGCSIEHSISAR